MSLLIGIIIGIIVLTLLVVAHEFGHALVAKRYGTVVEEFGIGFPPKVWSKKVKKSVLGKNVEYSLNLLPLGGFVKMQGEHDMDSGKGDYGTMSFWQKTQVLLAGVAVNWVLAALLLTVLAAIGMPKLLPNQFYLKNDGQVISQPVELASVTPELPAAKAGLQQGDKVLRLNGQVVTNPQALSELSAANKGKTVSVVYERQDVERQTNVALRSDNNDKRGYLGAGPAQRDVIKSTWSAPIVGVGTAMQMTGVTLDGLGQLIGSTVSGLAMKLNPNHEVQQKANQQLAEASSGVAGPLAIFGVIFPAAGKAGFTYVIMIAAIISLTLAVMNALPIPALDGGRWFVTAVYRLMRKPLTKETEEKIHGTGFMLLMLLVIAITVADIGKLR